MLFWSWCRTCSTCCTDRPGTPGLRRSNSRVHAVRLAFTVLFCVAAVAQAPPRASTDAAPEIDQPISRVNVTNIVAPALVTDRSGNIIDGLQPPQFHLFDNGKEQNIQVDVAF